MDVEDYFHVEAFGDVVERASWDTYPSRVERNTHEVLDLLDEHRARATFFILGWVADRHPKLVEEIVARGHETACHSYWHRLVFNLTQDEFADDTRRAKDSIEQAAGREVRGYRAPSFSITSRSIWAFETLAELGFEYDSSVFPIHHDVYGMPDAPRRPFRVETATGTITEFPMTTFRLVSGHNLPVGGGAYLRVLPSWYTRLGIARARRDGVPLIVYTHPWELDADQPRIAAGLRSRLRHYTGLRRTRRRLEGLLREGGYAALEDGKVGAAEPQLSTIGGG